MIARGVERQVPPIGSFVEVDGARIHYVDRGSGTPIVMIHGLAGVLQNFTHSLTGALTDSFRVVALDRPGAGYSVRPRGASAHLVDQATTIARFIRALDIERPLVVGHSLGGAIALALALEYPSLPRALALVAPLTQAERRPPGPFAGLNIASPLLRSLAAHTIAVPMAMLTGSRVVAGIFAPERVPGDFATAGGGLLGLRAAQFFNASTDMIASRDDMPTIVSRYRELQLPIHVLFGAQDAVLDPRKHAEGFHALVPHARVTVIPGGHMLPVTQPLAVARWVRSFA